MKTKHPKTPSSFSTSFSFLSFQPFSCFTLEISLLGFHVSCLHHFLCITRILSISPSQVASPLLERLCFVYCSTSCSAPCLPRAQEPSISLGTFLYWKGLASSFIASARRPLLCISTKTGNKGNFKLLRNMVIYEGPAFGNKSQQWHERVKNSFLLRDGDVDTISLLPSVKLMKITFTRGAKWNISRLPNQGLSQKPKKNCCWRHCIFQCLTVNIDDTPFYCTSYMQESEGDVKGKIINVVKRSTSKRSCLLKYYWFQYTHLCM